MKNLLNLAIFEFFKIIKELIDTQSIVFDSYDKQDFEKLLMFHENMTGTEE